MSCARGKSAGSRLDERADPAKRQCEAEDTTSQRDEEAFGQQLADHSQTRRTQGKPHGDFALPS